MMKKEFVILVLLLSFIFLQSCTGKASKEMENSESVQILQKIGTETGSVAQQQVLSAQQVFSDVVTEEFPEEFVVVSGTLIRYQGSEKEVVVPEGILTIGENAFANNKEITCIQLPAGLKVIRKSAFFDCSNLKEVIVPDTLEIIGDCAFERCDSLEDIDLHLVKVVRWAAFSRCKNLRTVDLTSVEELGEEAFWAAGIQEITGLEKIKSIGDRVLENTPVFEKYLTDGAGLFVQGVLLISGQHAKGTVEIPEGIKFILDRAFVRNGKITSVTFPDSVLQIGNGAFESCGSLERIFMSDSVVWLGEGAFNGCSGLRQVRLSQCLENMSMRCFSGCCNLEDITVPQGCTLGDGVFYYYGTGHKKLTFPPDAKNVGNLFEHIDDENFDMGGYCFYTTDLSESCSLVRIAKGNGWKLEALRLEATELILHIGEEYVLRFNSGAQANWAVSDSKVLGIGAGEHFSDLILTAQKEGVAVVTATIYGETYSCTVTVVGKEDD